jgi:nucleotide-binding universal stress UspA family protein
MSGFTQPLLVPSLKNILFATDFSPSSQAALPFLRAIAERYGSTVHVLHVLTPEPMLELPLDMPPELDADRVAAQFALNTLLAGKPFGNIASTATVARGPLWNVLAGFIEERSIDLIVLGTHGRRGLRKLVLGSVAEQIFRLARCPVLTINPHSAIAGKAPTRIAAILFATDFSSGSHRALPYAESLARTNHAHLILLHAVSAGAEIVPIDLSAQEAAVELPSEFAAQALADAREQMAEMVSCGTIRELAPEIIVEYGAAAETILSVAKSKQADLIVMGAHRAPGSLIASHLPWATASMVVCQAHCPVLTVRN